MQSRPAQNNGPTSRPIERTPTAPASRPQNSRTPVSGIKKLFRNDDDYGF
jgi:hypothetical protein